MNAYELSPCPESLEAPLMLVNWERYYGEIIYAYLEKEIPSVEMTLKEAEMWHPHFTAGKVTGMIMSAGYSVAELHEYATNTTLLSELALEALELITAEIPAEGPVVRAGPAAKKPHRIQQLPTVSYLSGPAAKAIRTMRPLFG
jgi:hypothetical protein